MEGTSGLATEGDLLRLARVTARGEGISEVDAEDIASHVLIKYIEAGDSVRFPRAWVKLVARRNAWNLRRYLSSQCPIEVHEHSALDPGVPHEETLLEQHLDIRAAMVSLNDEKRSLVYLRDFAGEGLESISKKTGLSVTTVKRRLKAARSTLRRALTGRAVGAPLTLAAELPSANLVQSETI